MRRLLHPEQFPVIPIRYIGPLSRFGKKISSDEAEYCDVLILLSGPEPQRTRFEKLIIDQLAFFPLNIPSYICLGRQQGNCFVASADRLPEPTLDKSGRLEVYDHLPADRLNSMLWSAGLVISRPGYSSVMDLFKLGKKCIFVPTPGQTEQEYLGEYLSGRKWALCMSQTAFSLSGALAAAGQFLQRLNRRGMGLAGSRRGIDRG